MKQPFTLRGGQTQQYLAEGDDRSRVIAHARTRVARATAIPSDTVRARVVMVAKSPACTSAGSTSADPSPTATTPAAIHVPTLSGVTPPVGINSRNGSIHVRDSTIQGVGGDGIDATSVDGNNVVWVQGSTITAAQENGIRVLNSNLRVERLDPTSPTSAATRITNTGVYGIVATADAYAAATSPYRVLVDSAQISGVINGIGVFANADPANPPPAPIVPPPPRVPTIDFTARNNNITATGGGISLSAIFDGSGGAPGQQLSQINALIVANNINVGETDTGILLNVSGDPTTFVDTTSGVTFTAPASQLPIVVAAANLIDLENLNNGTTVEITPINSRVNFNTGLVPATPPPPPAQPPP